MGKEKERQRAADEVIRQRVESFVNSGVTSRMGCVVLADNRGQAGHILHQVKKLGYTAQIAQRPATQKHAAYYVVEEVTTNA